MNIQHNAFADPALCRRLLERLTRTLNGAPLRFMEVCGTHTNAIFQSGLRSLLPANVTHLSGPGCPVCVTHDAEVAAFLQMAGRDNVIIATFGDMLRVPGPDGTSLKHAIAQGARVAVAYSPMDALTLARQNPDALIVFLGVGFETTAPTVAASILMAESQGIENFTVFTMHKRVPPALRALLDSAATHIDAFLLPGHVSTIIGIEPYRFLCDYGTPGVVAGFEPADILHALCCMAEQRAAGQCAVVNAYTRAVDDAGNPRACAVMEQVFTPTDALWRGLGVLAGSGLGFAPPYAQRDALKRLHMTLPKVGPLRGCRCGDVLSGVIAPPECPLFGRACTPAQPVGPCMVSTEGSCAAYYKYRLES